jgi:membrane protease YdiL (CAAX protease family)
VFDGAEAASATAPPSAPGVSRPEPEPGRYRLLQLFSLVLIAGGGALAFVAVRTAPELLSGEGPLPGEASRVVGALALASLAGLAVVVGLVANAARSLVVREHLPESRYRGPSLIVMLVLAIIAANLVAISAARDVAALLGEGELTPLGTAVILTVTQLGLLGSVALFVAAPRALAGVRLLPERGLWRSVVLGLVLSVPAWIGAQLIGVVIVRLLELVGMQPDVGVAEEALARADPAILVVALVIVAPIAEEVFFRGVVYNAWLREYGPTRALVGSAVLFGFIHGSIFLFVPILALGAVLALVYRQTGSLPAAIALHAGFNGITVALGLLVRFGILDLPVT